MTDTWDQATQGVFQPQLRGATPYVNADPTRYPATTASQLPKFDRLFLTVTSTPTTLTSFQGQQNYVVPDNEYWELLSVTLISSPALQRANDQVWFGCAAIPQYDMDSGGTFIVPGTPSPEFVIYNALVTGNTPFFPDTAQTRLKYTAYPKSPISIAATPASAILVTPPTIPRLGLVVDIWRDVQPGKS